LSEYFWSRAFSAIERRRGKLADGQIPDSEDSPVWKELDKLMWLEQFANASLRMEREVADLF
jgi:hypothetical protein